MEHSTNMNSHDQKALKLRFPILGSILVFTGSAFLSGVVGFWVGFYVWICSGQNPDNSGGTLIFFYGAVATGLLGLLVRCVTKRRAILYGITFFMWNTAFMMIMFAIA
jgi:hypothetical protein